MKIVLDSPMPTQSLGVLTHRHTPAADKVINFGRGLSSHDTLPIAHAHDSYLSPRLPVAQAVHVFDHYIGALLLAAVAFLARRYLSHDTRLKV